MAELDRSALKFRNKTKRAHVILISPSAVAQHSGAGEIWPGKFWIDSADLGAFYAVRVHLVPNRAADGREKDCQPTIEEHGENVRPTRPDTRETEKQTTNVHIEHSKGSTATYGCYPDIYLGRQNADSVLLIGRRKIYIENAAGRHPPARCAKNNCFGGTSGLGAASYRNNRHGFLLVGIPAETFYIQNREILDFYRNGSPGTEDAMAARVRNLLVTGDLKAITVVLKIQPVEVFVAAAAKRWMGAANQTMIQRSGDPNKILILKYF